MQSVLSRIWTRVAVSISYDDNHYTTGTISIKLLWYLYSLSQKSDTPKEDAPKEDSTQKDSDMLSLPWC